MQPKQILRILYLGGGMAQEGSADLRFFNTAAVVTDPDKTDAAVLNFHCNCRCPGIDGIFHQFLHDTGRSFHYFAGCDPVDCLMT